MCLNSLYWSEWVSEWINGDHSKYNTFKRESRTGEQYHNNFGVVAYLDSIIHVDKFPRLQGTESDKGSRIRQTWAAVCEDSAEKMTNLITPPSWRHEKWRKLILVHLCQALITLRQRVLPRGRIESRSGTPAQRRMLFQTLLMSLCWSLSWLR